MTNYLNSCKEDLPFDYFRTGDDVETWLGLPRLFNKIAFWHNRSRQRAHLGNLNAHLLKDIGVTAEQAEFEAGKQFWID